MSQYVVYSCVRLGWLARCDGAVFRNWILFWGWNAFRHYSLLFISRR